jgi:hypothetical protein
MDTKDSIQHIAASNGLSSGNPTGLTVGLFGAIDSFKPDVIRLPIPVDGGLLGQRFSCVNVRHEERFKSVKTVSDLTTYRYRSEAGDNE